MATNEIVPIEISNETIESMIHIIRGQKVMLDFDLARIYGYETKAFNQQVKRNIEKFPDDFMFQLTKIETEELSRSQIVTMNSSDKRGYNFKYSPYAFTEQGVYMLMTVLKGELATRQSILIVRAFKKMKDYIIENQPILGVNDVIKLTQTVDEHSKDIIEIKRDLKIVMDNFVDESTHKHFLILDGQKLEADIAYQNLYKQAQTSIIIIDDYIDVKTLQLLKSSKDGIDIKIISDNKARNSLTASFVSDSGLNISFIQNLGKFHDRYIIIDYKTAKEKLYHCGSSSKDSGAKITAINFVDDATIYHTPVDEVLSNPALIIS